MRRQEAPLPRVIFTTLFGVLVGAAILLVLIVDPSKAARLQGTEAIARLEVENGKIAYVRKGDVYAMNADGSGAQRLTHTVGRVILPGLLTASGLRLRALETAMATTAPTPNLGVTQQSM